jgi:hypothetical protein
MENCHKAATRIINDNLTHAKTKNYNLMPDFKKLALD